MKLIFAWHGSKFLLTFSHKISPIILTIPPSLLSRLILKVLFIKKINIQCKLLKYFKVIIYSIEFLIIYLKKLSLQTMMSLQFTNIFSTSSSDKTLLATRGFSKT